MILGIENRAAGTGYFEGSGNRVRTLSLAACGLVSAALLSGCSGSMRSGRAPVMRTAPPVEVAIQENLDRLLREEDTDGDQRITIHDPRFREADRGDRRFALVSLSGRRYEVHGTYFLSNLLQELKLAEEGDSARGEIDLLKVFENPVRRISRSIRDSYWDNLTRRIDADHLDQILKDEKVLPDGKRYLYVPHSDARAYEYFSQVAAERPELQLRAERLPAQITPEFVKGLNGRHGLLTLALETGADGEYEGVPFVVPGGRFNEMYGWDSYFVVLGLLEDRRLDLAKAMVDNFVYQIHHYGKILNANRTYYLTRSQPPFLTSMALAVFRRLPSGPERMLWLQGVMRAAIQEYEQVWMNPERLTETGLSRYYGSGSGPPPEVEPGHFDAVFCPYAERHNLNVAAFVPRYLAGEIRQPELDRFFVHDRCVRESGHDTTYRWNVRGNVSGDPDDDRCADFVTVDLNALLYKFELDIARTIKEEFNDAFTRQDGTPEKSKAWFRRAGKRKKLIRRYLWDKKRAMFFDYDVTNKRRHGYVSATTFYPLWAGYRTEPGLRILTREETESLLAAALPLLEMPGGMTASTEKSRGVLSERRPARQWDYPNGWPPHQMIVWQGLINNGYDEAAHRLIYRWLYTITRNAADYNGTIPETLDVVRRSHEVFAEYGNVGTKFAYITREGFGWMNASYQVGLKLLPANLRSSLEAMVPPEWIFDR